MWLTGRLAPDFKTIADFRKDNGVPIRLVCREAFRYIAEDDEYECPFGTLKAWMGSTHFLTRTLDRVSTEMSLHVLAYNMKRMMNILGSKTLIEAIGA